MVEWEGEKVASTLTAIVNMTDDRHVREMAEYCISQTVAADAEMTRLNTLLANSEAGKFIETQRNEITRLKEELAGCNKAFAISDTAHQKCREIVKASTIAAKALEKLNDNKQG